MKNTREVEGGVEGEKKLKKREGSKKKGEISLMPFWA